MPENNKTVADILTREGSGARITDGDYWLVFDDSLPAQWIIYVKHCGQRKTRVAFQSSDESEAVDVFLRYTEDK